MTERDDDVDVRERRRAIGHVIRFSGLAAEVGGRGEWVAYASSGKTDERR